jgi:RNA polymerase sigma-70 factor (ECF subfamily)
LSLDTATPLRDSEAMAELVRRIVSGDPTAEAELVRRFSRAVSFLLRRLARDEALMEDLYQETFRRNGSPGS